MYFCLALVAMIVPTCIRLASSKPDDLVWPPAVRIDGLPDLFGGEAVSTACVRDAPTRIRLFLSPTTERVQPNFRVCTFEVAAQLGGTDSTHAGSVTLIGRRLHSLFLLLGSTGVFAFYPHWNDFHALNFVQTAARPAGTPASWTPTTKFQSSSRPYIMS